MNEEAKIKEMISNALDQLYANDKYLIFNQNGRSNNHASERSIVFRFGIYFDKLAQEYFPGFQVDTEYNRNMGNPKILPSWEKGSFPDLILHKRGSNSRNILVIEMKTWWNPSLVEDKLKVKEYCDPSGEYQYKYGALILIKKFRKNVKLEFFVSGKEES